jgi:hypothetical protein
VCVHLRVSLRANARTQRLCARLCAARMREWLRVSLLRENAHSRAYACLVAHAEVRGADGFASGYARARLCARASGHIRTPVGQRDCARRSVCMYVHVCACMCMYVHVHMHDHACASLFVQTVTSILCERLCRRRDSARLFTRLYVQGRLRCRSHTLL